MEPVSTQVIPTAELNSTKEGYEHLSSQTQSVVLEDRRRKAKSAGTVTCDSQGNKHKRVHECIHCKKTFTRKFDLKRHQKSQHPEASLSNDNCGAEISGSKQSVAGGTFKCDVYDGILQAVIESVITQEVIKVDASSPSKHVEQLSENVLTTIDDDRLHPMNTFGARICSYVQDKTRQWHVCLQCGNAFTRKFDLKRHEKTLHAVVKAPDKTGEAEFSGNRLVPEACTTEKSQHKRTFKCKVCERLFTRKSDVQRHVLRIHSKIALLECKICQKKYYEKAELAAHKCIHKGYRPYQCEICMKRFRQKSALIIHMRVHTGEKPYQCDVCMKSFSQMSVLNQHKRVHTGEKPYQCGICLKAFSEMSNLHKHMRIHTGEKPFQCEICLKRFSLKSVLNQHKRIHTGEKPYQCEICLKRFNKKSVVNQHKRVHTGEKPYQCEACLKKFSEKSALDRHRLVHTGEKPYECETCMKRFREKSALSKHRCVPMILKSNHIREDFVKIDSAKLVVLKTYSKFRHSVEAVL